MERKINSLEQHVTFLYDELEKKEVEIDNIKELLDDANKKFRLKAASYSHDKDDLSELKNVVDEQKIKISCLRKHRNEILDRHEKMVDDYEDEFKLKEAEIKGLQEDLKIKKQQNTDLKEEHDARLQEIAVQENIVKNLELKSSQSSLSEELKAANNEEEMKMLNKENRNLKNKVNKLEDDKKKKSQFFESQDESFKTMQKNIQGLKSSLIKLHQQKSKCNLEWKCNRIFCNLDHSYLYRKVNKTSARKVFPCVKCDSIFRKESELEVHVRTEHVEVLLFECESCSFKCKSVGKLQNHLSKKHQPSSNNERNSMVDKFEEEIGIQENDKKGEVQNVKVKKVKEKEVNKIKGKGARRKRISQKFSNAEGGKDVCEILETPNEPFEADVGSEEDISECSETKASEISSSLNFSEQSVLESESGEEDSIQSGGMSSIN